MPQKLIIHSFLYPTMQYGQIHYIRVYESQTLKVKLMVIYVYVKLLAVLQKDPS